MHRAMLICLLPPGSVVMSMARISTEVFETILCWASHTLHWPWDAVTGPVTLAGYCSRRDDPTHLGRAHSLIGKDGPTPHHSCVPHWGRILELIQLSRTWENKRCPPLVVTLVRLRCPPSSAPCYLLQVKDPLWVTPAKAHRRACPVPHLGSTVELILLLGRRVEPDLRA